VLDAFTKDLAAGKTENERAVALWNVGAAKVRDPRIADKVIPFLTKEGDAMRGEAAAALAGYPGDKHVAGALNTALGANRTRPRVIEKLVAAIVAVGHESSVQFLEQVLRSGDPKLGAAAARALGSFRTDDSVEALLGVYERLTAERMGAARLGGDAKKAVEERIRLFEPPIQESLTRLTGQKLAGWAEYKTWWKANKAAFNAPPSAAPASAPPASAPPTSAAPASAAPATAAPAAYADPLPKIPDAKGYELVYELDLARLGRDITYDKDTYNARQTLFAINNWKQGSQAATGIGNSPTGNPDWTFRNNASSYVFKNLRVFVRPKK
jgi:hypothetical protein